MKKLIVMLLVVAIVITMTACGEKTNGVEEPSGEVGQIEDIKDGNGGDIDVEESEKLGDEQEDEIEERDKADDFTMKDVNGNEVSLFDFLGKKIVLIFWGTTIMEDDVVAVPPGFEEKLQEYEELHQKSKDSDYVVVTVAGTSDENIIKDYVKGKGYTMPILLDTESIGYYIYGAMAIPTIYYIDSEGYIVDTGGSRTTKEDILDAVENMD
ncbi:MAG TPA: TlpA family protein disulfide reductase [Thermoanaerobacterales bacterium]|nr:TlpA family protein disulfide reductase [Thermoanaerobacterales bacterium]